VPQFILSAVVSIARTTPSNVKGDFMVRVGFIGVPGCGKTSTARGLASSCRRLEEFQNVELSTEYARRYIAKYGAITQCWEQYRILNKQLDWEETVGKVDMTITDSPIFMSFMYAQQLCDGSPKDVMIVNDIFSALNKLNNPTKRYDVIFFVPPILKPVADGIRSDIQFNQKWREEANQHLLALTRIFAPQTLHMLTAVDLPARVDECITVLKEVSNASCR
jgi:nicotinamide riboside kinase